MASSLMTVMGWLGETVIKRLIDKVWDKIPGLGSQDGESAIGDAFRDLEISLIKIKPTIDKAENMWIIDVGLRQNVNKLLVLLKDAAYDAEDLLDKFEFQKLQQKIKQQGNEASDDTSSLLSFPFPSRPNKRKFGEYNNHEDVTELRKIREKLDNTNITLEKLLSSDNNRGKMQMINEMNRVTSSVPVETQVFGRHEELNEIMRLLLQPHQSGFGSGYSKNISILTVTGMGGVGKTTLAQEAYNDKRVEEYFNLRIWVCVSEHFNVERLTKEIIESSTKKKYKFLNFNTLQEDLKKEITSKKFLLVLDDVWNEDRCKWDKHMWDKLCAPLRSGVRGSKIFITTRDEKIAKMVGCMNQIYLNCLDDDNSWAFFKKCVFGSQNSSDYPRLEAIAKEMVPKLKGLPLAAKTLGGLLSMNMNEQHWRTIMDSEIWKLPQEENGVLLVLQVSYYYLPAHLKQCFAFCSLYPKDYEFGEHELVHIWMAEGFFPTEKKIRMEDYGSNCFQGLVSRSFFQKSQNYSDKYVMHDMIHDLAQLISKEETYRLEDGEPFEIPTLHRLNIMSIPDDKKLRRMVKSNDFSKLRTLICHRQESLMNSLLTCGFFNTLQRIRTLILRDCGLREFPERVGDLLYLRYLDISWNENLDKLPESLCRLSNLQTLLLYGCDGLQSLPQGVTKLISLRTFDAGDDLVSKITSVGKLTSLQSLSIFKVRKEHGYKLAELSGLTALHGRLRIMNLENVESKEEAITAKLQNKVHLDNLVLQWATDQEDDALLVSEQVLEHLQPNSTLKRLTIERYNGARSPSWLEAKSLSKLESLSLKDCKQWDADLSFCNVFNMPECQNARMAEWFPRLSALEIDDCPLVTRLPPLPPSLTMLKLNGVGLIEILGGIGRSSSNRVTSSPLKVQISRCPNLTSLDAIEHFPCLSALTIDDCPLLTRLPPLSPSLVELQLIQVGLTELPGIGGSSGNITTVSLSRLHVENCSNMISVEQGLCHNLPKLENLVVSDCGELLWMPMKKFKEFTNLEFLLIENCPKLMSMAQDDDMHLLLPPSIQSLKFSNCGKVGPDCLDNLPTLRSLKLFNCPHLETLARERLLHFEGLDTLHLVNCNELRSIKGLGVLKSLRTLKICGCPKLQPNEGDGRAGENIFSEITILMIDDTSLLKVLPLRNMLPSIRELAILFSRELNMFEGADELLRSLTSLECLRFYSCDNLQSLPTELHALPSLKFLHFSYCPHIQSLPEELPISIRIVSDGYCHPRLEMQLQERTWQDEEDSIQKKIPSK